MDEPELEGGRDRRKRPEQESQQLGFHARVGERQLSPSRAVTKRAEMRGGQLGIPRDARIAAVQSRMAAFEREMQPFDTRPRQVELAKCGATLGERKESCPDVVHEAGQGELFRA